MNKQARTINGGKHTLGKAAAACGKNKSTVLRAIKSGKLPATRNAHKQWQIDPAVLHQVYPPVVPPVAALAMAEQRQRLAELKALLEDMRNQRDAWQRVAEMLATKLKKRETK
jgi:hypothetical protein